MSAIIQVATAPLTGALFGLAYGTAIRIGYEQIYPYLFPADGKGKQPIPSNTTDILRGLEKMYDVIGGKGAHVFGIEQGIKNAGGSGTVQSGAGGVNMVEEILKSFISTQPLGKLMLDIIGDFTKASNQITKNLPAGYNPDTGKYETSAFDQLTDAEMEQNYQDILNRNWVFQDDQLKIDEFMDTYNKKKKAKSESKQETSTAKTIEYANKTYDQNVVGRGLSYSQLQTAIKQYDAYIKTSRDWLAQNRGKSHSTSHPKVLQHEANVRLYIKIRDQYEQARSWIRTTGNKTT